MDELCRLSVRYQTRFRKDLMNGVYNGRLGPTLGRSIGAY